MELYKEDKVALREMWDNPVLRQQAKLIFTLAIGNATDLSVKEATLVMDELDELLKDEEEATERKTDPAI